mmetsp:Transcript_98642/g.254783  ORF Transcript_98642/g.254783 Transcript_98642/m.254783 type:complete len:885 (+) Transcript_98642:954-3608(+)
MGVPQTSPCSAAQLWCSLAAPVPQQWHRCYPQRLPQQLQQEQQEQQEWQQREQRQQLEQQQQQQRQQQQQEQPRSTQQHRQTSHRRPAPEPQADPVAVRHVGFSGGRLRLRVVRAMNLRNTALGISPDDMSDPFVVARLGRQEFKTDVISNNLNPIWNSRHFEFALEGEDPVLELEVYNSQQWHAHDSLGKLHIRVADLVAGKKDTIRGSRGILDEEGAYRDDGKQGSLEVEVLYLSADQLAGGRGAHAYDEQTADTGLQSQKKKDKNWVPLPSFHHLGPEAFKAPQPKIEEALVGQQRKIMAMSSRACRLGQYDYSREPDYNPNLEEVDKRRWKDDPFYGWRRELSRTEHGVSTPAMLADSPEGRGQMGQRNPRDASRAILAEYVPANTEQENEQWKNDPFHGWLKHDKAGHPDNNVEKVQEAAVARQLMSLPSFRDVDKTRFADHREYATTQQAAENTRGRLDDGAERVQQASQEKRWKDDAFFGWLPGRGPDTDQQHHLQRPLRLARDSRLPSFSESPELLGITGRQEAIGILNVWINSAFDLRYDDGCGLQGKPSACVKIKVGDGPEKVTSVIPMNANPKWNTPAMTFEVSHAGELLKMEVVDLANARSDQHLHRAFLGSVEKDMGDIQAQVLQEQLGPTEPLRLLEHLSGAASQNAKLDFEVMFEPYDDERDGSVVGSQGRPRLHDEIPHRPQQSRSSRQTLPPPSQRSQQMPSSRSRQTQLPSQFDAPPRRMARSNASFRSTASSELAGAGVLTVRVMCAHDLVNKDSGMYGDVSDPFVTMRLDSWPEDQRKRTQTINNNLNPVWNTDPFLFPLSGLDESLILEVWDENMLSEPDFLGRLIVPLIHLKSHANTTVDLRNRLLDVEHGELEVQLGYSPG